MLLHATPCHPMTLLPALYLSDSYSHTTIVNLTLRPQMVQLYQCIPILPCTPQHYLNLAKPCSPLILQHLRSRPSNPNRIFMYWSRL